MRKDVGSAPREGNMGWVARGEVIRVWGGVSSIFLSDKRTPLHAPPPPPHELLSPLNVFCGQAASGGEESGQQFLVRVVKRISTGPHCPRMAAVLQGRGGGGGREPVVTAQQLPTV